MAAHEFNFLLATDSYKVSGPVLHARAPFLFHPGIYFPD